MRIVMSFSAAALLLSVAAAPAGAEPMVVSWTTWMRAAPSEQARAIDEVGTGTQLQVQACQDGWCRVRESGADGYVQQRYLAASLQGLQRGAGDCFAAQYYTAENPLPLTICPAKKQP